MISRARRGNQQRKGYEEIMRLCAGWCRGLLEIRMLKVFCPRMMVINRYPAEETSRSMSKSATVRTGLPAQATMRSSFVSPALAAGLSAGTSSTNTPDSSGKHRLAIRDGRAHSIFQRVRMSEFVERNLGKGPPVKSGATVLDEEHMVLRKRRTVQRSAEGQ